MIKQSKQFKNIQFCLICGHSIDCHLEQVDGVAIAGECSKCDCKCYKSLGGQNE